MAKEGLAVSDDLTKTANLLSLSDTELVFVHEILFQHYCTGAEKTIMLNRIIDRIDRLMAAKEQPQGD